MTESIERIITDMRLKEELCPFLETGVRANSRIISDVLQRSGYDYDRRRVAYSSDERIRGWWPALK